MGAALPVAIGLQAGGALLSAKAAQDSGAASARYYNMLGLGSDLNADLTAAAGERNANQVQDQGARDTHALAEGVARTEGTQAAVMAANGTAGGATAEDIMRDTRAKARLDELAIRYNADVKSSEIRRGTAVDVMNKRMEGAGYRLTGSNKNAEGKANSILSLVGGASQVASTMYASRR